MLLWLFWITKMDWVFESVIFRKNLSPFHKAMINIKLVKKRRLQGLWCPFAHGSSYVLPLNYDGWYVNIYFIFFVVHNSSLLAPFSFPIVHKQGRKILLHYQVMDMLFVKCSVKSLAISSIVVLLWDLLFFICHQKTMYS